MSKRKSMSEAARALGRVGGKVRGKRYDKATLSKWAKKGGRPRVEKKLDFTLRRDILQRVFEVAGISERNGEFGSMLLMSEWRLLQRTSKNPSLLPKLLDAIRERKERERKARDE